ncbi:MAG: hypothetical protein ACHP7J_04885 [Terriglobales bacterium]
MRRRNSSVPLLILFFLTIPLTANAQTASGTPPAQPSSQAASPPPPPSLAGSGSSSQAPAGEDSGFFVF